MNDSLQDVYKQMVQDCLNRKGHLSDGELGFIDSLNTRLNAGKILSPKQIEKLESIWEDCTEGG